MVGARFPEGVSQPEAVAQLRASGQDVLADVVAKHWSGARRGHRLSIVSRKCSGWRLDFMLCPRCFCWLQNYLLNGAVQRTIYGMRKEIETKINRLPLSYFDGCRAANC